MGVIDNSAGIRRSPAPGSPATGGPTLRAGGPASTAGRPAAAERPDGRSARWEDHRQTRRAELIHATRRAIHHHGADLSMDELAAELGTSKSILYRYFTDKAGLQAEVGQLVLAELRAALHSAGRATRSPRDRLAAMVDTYLQMTKSSAPVYTFVTRPQDGRAAGDLRGFVTEVEKIVAHALLAVLVPAHRPPDPRDTELAAIWAAGMVGFVRGAAEHWMDARPTDPAGVTPTHSDLTAHLTTWLWYGAAGVGRRARSTRPQPATPDPPGAPDERNHRTP